MEDYSQPKTQGTQSRILTQINRDVKENLPTIFQMQKTWHEQFPSTNENSKTIGYRSNQLDGKKESILNDLPSLKHNQPFLRSIDEQECYEVEQAIIRRRKQEFKDMSQIERDECEDSSKLSDLRKNTQDYLNDFPLYQSFALVGGKIYSKRGR